MPSNLRVPHAARRRCAPTAAAICSLAGSVASFAQTTPILFITNGSSLRAYEMPSLSLLWSVDTGFGAATRMEVLPDRDRSVVLVVGPAPSGAMHTTAFEARSGQALWELPGDVTLEMPSLDVHRELYTNRIVYPCGGPRWSPESSVLVALGEPGAGSSTVRVVDSWTGEVRWTASYPCDTYPNSFLLTTRGGYDLILRTSSGCGTMARVDGRTGAVLWTYASIHRSVAPVPDLTGDGQFDLFTRANYSTAMPILSGATGSVVCSGNYGSFDVLGLEVAEGTGGAAADVIVAAQGASNGAIRRYRATGCGQVAWSCPAAYSDNTMLGLYDRAGRGKIVLSGWRHRARAIAVDAQTGQVLWDNVPLTDADSGAVAVPDVTGDGTEDILSISGSFARLYDGLTGAVVSGFEPIPAAPESKIAVWVQGMRPECPADYNKDGVVNSQDFFDFLAAFFAGCG